MAGIACDNSFMRFLLCILATCASTIAWGQEQIGTLIYRTPAGRGMTLVIVNTGPGLAGLRPEQGDAETFRHFVQKHCVSESTLGRNAKTLIEKPPAAYKSASGSGPLISTPIATYWRYAPGLVLPVRFKCMGQTWELIDASVPSRALGR